MGLERLYQQPIVHKPVQLLGLDLFIRRWYNKFKLSRDSTQTIKIDGFKTVFAESTLIADKWLSTELEVISEVFPKLNDDDIFYDVGADAGLYSLLATDRVAKTIAFEPHPIRRLGLEKNCQLNKDKGINIRSEALADYEGETNIEYGLVEEGGGFGSYKTDVRRGDGLIQDGLRSPTVLKIDVEGAELSVAKGLKSTLSNPECRLLLIEVHEAIDEFGGSEEELIDLLENCGFDVSRITQRAVEDSTEQFVLAQK